MSARTHPRHHVSDAVGCDVAGARSGSGGPRAAAAVAHGSAAVAHGAATAPRAVAAVPRGAARPPRGAAAGLRAGGLGLRWWGLVPPVIGFSALFLLMTGAGQAQATALPSPLVFLGWIQLALSAF
ncbi:hypothetical protein [Streptomyces pacificus]|uniref:Uncharacterized protein n=1 Tax=Streptomyces pacificus TaxID=2705029 RepID=A0A6A0ASC0_9ACTN|nr:hypothetical protein [Streptomyces pacificus]GFH35345.1 hypothetical protein SCWH03_15600 [Streptomyces pacificus]